MISLIIILLTFYQSQAASLTQNVTGSLDDGGVCHCTINLPDTTFPVERLEGLEMSSRNLSTIFEKEISKIQIYEHTLIVYTKQLTNLTKRVEVMELGGLSYTKLDFELLELEITEMKTLILQLKNSFNGSNVIVETLYQEIQNISIFVSQLEVYDQNNVMVIRREIEALKKRLEECEKNEVKPPLLPSTEGNCQYGQISNISEPFVVQLNWLGANNKYGGWGRDSYLGANQENQWVSLLSSSYYTYEVRFYPSYNRLLTYSHSASKTFPYSSAAEFGQGGGMIMYNGSLYYNCYNSRNLCKLNTTSFAVERVSLYDAAFNNRFSYASVDRQDIDFSGDEDGLWVIYATEPSAGNIVISKLDPISLVVLQSWQTALYKPAVTNAFMVCGVMYATRALSTQAEEIFYMYDTKTGKEHSLSIRFHKMLETVQNLHYNPNDHKLYMFNNGYEICYDLIFKPKE